MMETDTNGRKIYLNANIYLSPWSNFIWYCANCGQKHEYYEKECGCWLFYTMTSATLV